MSDKAPADTGAGGADAVTSALGAIAAKFAALSGSDGGDAVSDPSDAGVAKVRETAKWMVAIAGVIGGVLIGSLSLADMGGLDGAGRDSAARWALVAVLGVVIIIVAASMVLVPGTVSIDALHAGPLRRYVDDHPGELGGFPSFEEARAYYRDASRDRIVAYQRMVDLAQTGDPDKKLDAATTDYKLANNRLDLVNPVIDRILAAVSFERVRSRFVRVGLPGIGIGMVVAAAGTVMFASQVAQPAGAKDAVEARPARVVIALDSDVRPTYGALLGGACDLAGIEATVIETSDDAWSVVVTDSQCASASFEIPHHDAQVTPVRSALPPPGGGPTGPSKTS